MPADGALALDFLRRKDFSEQEASIATVVPESEGISLPVLEPRSPLAREDGKFNFKDTRTHWTQSKQRILALQERLRRRIAGSQTEAQTEAQTEVKLRPEKISAADALRPLRDLRGNKVPVQKRFSIATVRAELVEAPTTGTLLTCKSLMARSQAVTGIGNIAGFTVGLPKSPEERSLLVADEAMPAKTPEPESEDMPTPAEIQERFEQLQQRLEDLEEVPLQQIFLGNPGSSSNVPSAYGGSWGSIGMWASFQERTRFTRTADGTIGLTASFGNPRKVLGLDAGVNILDLSSFARRGSFNFKLHRVLPEEFAIAVGIQNSIIWGFSDVDTSVYGVVSKRLRLRESSRKPLSRLYLSVGLGNGRFRSEDDVINNVNSLGFFGSAAIQVIKEVNVFAEWTGQDLNVGASVVPLPEFPNLVITPNISDMTGSAGDGARFTVGVGYGFSF